MPHIGSIGGLGPLPLELILSAREAGCYGRGDRSRTWWAALAVWLPDSSSVIDTIWTTHGYDAGGGYAYGDETVHSLPPTTTATCTCPHP